MKLSNIKDILKDWAKGSYHFGRGVSNYVADKMEVSPEKSRVGTAVFDTVAGAGLTFMAASSALGTATGALLAIPALLSAPTWAVPTLVLAPVWLTFSAMTGSLGVGLLSAAREKFGLGSSADVSRTVETVRAETSSTLSSIIARGKKASAEFKAAVSPKSAPAAQEPADKPANKPTDLRM